MAMKRTREPWMTADAFGRSLPRGLGVNLLVDAVAPMATFLDEVLSARLVHADEDFAVAELAGSLLLVHADHTYDRHPLSGVVAGLAARGAGVELRVYGIDPDGAEARARRRGDIVLAGSSDKPHGLRECAIIGPCGYVFVPSAAIGTGETES